MNSQSTSFKTSESQRRANQKYRERNREKIRLAAKEYREANKHRLKKYPHKPGYMRGYHYQKKYGISLEEYNQWLEWQDNVCAICKQPETAKTKQGDVAPLCVDHSHKTGKVRGLLCRNCNSALGKFQDSVDVLQSAQEYLQNDTVD